jgi:hypothetical protein
MKTSILVKTLIIAFSLLANTMFLFSQELIFQKEVIFKESKCPSLIVTPLNQNVTSSSGTTSFTVASNIAWTSSSNQTWCTVTPSGTGNGTIRAAYQSNTGAGSRTAAITVSGSGVSDQVVTVTQLGTAPALIVTPLNQNVTSSSGTTSFTVASNVAWTSSSDQAWCTVTPSGTGNGNGNITATYQANTETSARTATITVKGSGVSEQVVTVTQSGEAPSLIVTPLNQNVTSSSGTTSFTVASNVAWTSSSDQTWCTVTPSGTDNGTITATYQENTGISARTATITVMGSGVSNQVVTVTQSGAPTSLIVTPLNQNVTSSSGTTSFDVASNVAWTSSSDQAWCTVTPSGTGNGTITTNYQANTGATSRVATITIMGSGVSNQVVTLTQDELITISYAGSPWCPSGDVQDVSLSGSSGGTYSARPDGLNINPLTGAITPGTSIAGSYVVKYSLEKSGGSRILEDSTEVAIYLNIAPQIVIKWEDVLICSNIDNLFLGYQWFNGTTPIIGANNQYYVTSKTPGVYTVEAIDKNGCKAMSNEISIGGTNSILVYPNPVKSSFKISINDVPVGKAHIRIINAAGTEVMNLNTEKSDFEFSKEISTNDLNKGFYLVQVTVNEFYLYIVKIMVIK